MCAACDSATSSEAQSVEPSISVDVQPTQAEREDIKLDERMQSACTSVLTRADRDARLAEYSDKEISDGCGILAFMSYHDWQPYKSEEGKRQMTHTVEVLEGAANKLPEDWTQFQTEMVDQTESVVINAIKDLAESE